MVVPSNSFQETNEENLNSNLQPGEKEVQELANKVNTQIQRGNDNIKSTEYFIAKRKLDESFNYQLNDNFDWPFKKANLDQLSNDLSPTLQPSSLYSIPPYLTPSQFFEYEQRLIRIQTEYDDYINKNKPFSLNIPKQTSQVESKILGKEEMRVFQRGVYNLLSSLQIVSRKTRRLIKHIPQSALILLSRVLIAYLFYQLIRSIYGVFIWGLKLALSFLPKKKAAEKVQGKKEKKDEQKEIEESKEFWNKNASWWSEIIKINRGGQLVPLHEVNIYEFSEFDKQHALLVASCIPSLIKLRNEVLKLNELLLNSKPTWIQQKVSRFKFKKLSSQVRAFILGIVIFMSTISGTTVSTRTRNFSQHEMAYSSQVVMTSVVPVCNLQMNKPSVKDEHNISMISSPTKEQLNITKSRSSRLTFVNRVRKRAKMVRLSDLPPLTDQYLDIDTYSSPIVQTMPIKVS